MVEIDYINLQSLGVSVLQSNGEMDFPEIKYPLQHNWADRNGLDIDLSTAYQSSRIISIEFLIQAITMEDYQNNIEAFMSLLQSNGLRKLKYDYLDKPIFAKLNNEVKIDQLTGYAWSKIYGKCICEFIEPYPVGRFFYLESGLSVSMTISSSSILRVDWGDASLHEYILGEGVTLTHDFDSDVTETFVGVFGNIGDITSLTVVGLIEIV